MDSDDRFCIEDFAGILTSTVELDTLERITKSLDSELADSQKAMQDIKAIFDAMPVRRRQSMDGANSSTNYEAVSRVLNSGEPKLLLPDMTEKYVDVDLDDIIATMKGYVEELKKTCGDIEPLPQSTVGDMKDINIGLYAFSLDQLCKCLSELKLTKQDGKCKVNSEFEQKFNQLCEDVDMFTKMIQAKQALGESNQNWIDSSLGSNALRYNNMINKLVSGITEVMYLLENSDNLTAVRVQ